MERSSIEMVRSPLLDRNLPMVGAAFHLDLHQPPRHALKRVGILRCRLHHSYHRQHLDGPTVLCDTIHSHEHPPDGNLRSLAD